MSASVHTEGPPLDELRSTCNKLATTPPGDIQQMASLLQNMSLDYYRAVRRQAQQSFYSALAAAIVGILFFVYAAFQMMPATGSGSSAYISLIAGTLVQVISGINFYFYAKAARQFSGFHVCLERTNRFILANSLTENLEGEAKTEMRVELIRAITNAPLLTVEVLEGGGRSSRSQIPRRSS